MDAGPDAQLYGWTVGPSLMVRDRHRRQSSRVVEGRTCDRIEKRMKRLMSPYVEEGSDGQRRVDPSYKEDKELVFRLSRLKKQLRYRRRIDGFRKVMRQYPVRPTWETPEGDTALHSACMWGHVEMVNDLLNHGWNINKLNAYKQTPLILASKEGYWRVVKLLLRGSKMGGKPILKAKDNMGMTCIGWAAKVAAHQGTKSRGCAKVVEMLEAEWSRQCKERRKKRRRDRLAKRRTEMMEQGEDSNELEDAESDDGESSAKEEEEEDSESEPESSLYEDFGESSDHADEEMW